jgi:hypothetical protein
MSNTMVIEQTIYHTWGEHVIHYTTDTVQLYSKMDDKYDDFVFHYTLQFKHDLQIIVS